MICVSIGRSRHKMVVAEHRHLAERGARLVEIRLDWIGRVPNVGKVLRDKPTPVIMTCRRPDDQGKWRWSEEQRLGVLREAIVAGVDYVDLEEDIAGNVPRYGDTKRIVSYHNFDETPENLAEIHAGMYEKDPDIVKIVTFANSPADNVRMLQLVDTAKVPTVGFCMGEFGAVSRILCGKYGSPFTYASFSSSRQLAPGQLSFDDMSKVYRFDSINRETDVYGVLGDPVAHSLSPLIHNNAFHEQNVSAVYVPLHVPADRFQESLDAFEWLRIRGYSVTIPHKHAALEYSETQDDAAGEIGAANTLVVTDNKWHATNTDYDAALESIQLGLEADGDENRIAGKHVLMLGAGGVARAVGQGILKSDGRLTIANRTAERAEQLAAELGCDHVPWDDRSGVDPDVVVNCTSVGMHPNVDEAPFDADWLRDDALVFDTVYTPESTLLLKQSRERGCRTASGIEMFVRQAARQYKLFTGRDAPIDDMRGTLRRVLSAVRH